jgi:hypothetical protein
MHPNFQNRKIFEKLRSYSAYERSVTDRDNTNPSSQFIKTSAYVQIVKFINNTSLGLDSGVNSTLTMPIFRVFLYVMCFTQMAYRIRQTAHAITTCLQMACTHCVRATRKALLVFTVSISSVVSIFHLFACHFYNQPLPSRFLQR